MSNLTRFDITGRVAIVTGGAGLLGAEFCDALAEAGAKVVVADISREAANQVANHLNNRYSDVSSGVREGCSLAIATDVTSKASVASLVNATLDAFGRLDILVNSAALDPKFDSGHLGEAEETDESRWEQSSSSDDYHTTFENYPLEMWNQALEVNLTGMFLCCQAAVRPMLQQEKGVIINLSSIYGLVGPDQRIYQGPDQPVKLKPVYYSVTKAGVLGLTRYLATYYAGRGVRVNALTPGGVENEHDPGFVQAYSARAVLGRMARKDEMNGALLFLASDASSYMTGANLVVDGGWTAW
jgi:2-deoxy-D-gluconate 3-dehydrogenase